MKQALIAVLVVAAAIFVGYGPVLAHSEKELPNPGLTPSSPFYFLDRFGEFMREFFTFSPEGKARLQVEFSAERVAEVKLTLETHGANSGALETALSRLQKNVSRAADFVAEERNEGKEVDELAQEIGEGFEEQRDLLEEIFEERTETLKIKEEELKARIEKVADDEEIGKLLEELDALAKELEVLEIKEEVLGPDDNLDVDMDADVDLRRELESLDQLEIEIQQEIGAEEAKTEVKSRVESR